MTNPTTKKGTTMKKLLTLHAVNIETGDLVVCCLDLTKFEESDKLFRQFVRLITHKGYILEGAR